MSSPKRPIPDDPSTCEESEALHRDLNQFREDVERRVAPLRRLTRRLKRSVGLDAPDDTGAHAVVAMPSPSRAAPSSRPVVIEESDPFPSRPSRPSFAGGRG